MIAAENTRIDMVGHAGGEQLMARWCAELAVGWVVLGKKGIEKAVKLDLAYETDVADLHTFVPCARSWLP